MKVTNLLKTLVIETLAVSAGETQALSPQAIKTNAVAVPKFKGDLATPGFICPHLPWQDKFHIGNTGYIDGIRMNDLSHPVMCEIDKWNRPFIAFKYVCTRIQDTVATVTKGAVTFFQRYTDSSRPIVSGGHFMPKGCGRWWLGPIDPQDSATFATDFPKCLNGEPISFLKTESILVEGTTCDETAAECELAEKEIAVELRICDEERCPSDIFQLPRVTDN